MRSPLDAWRALSAAQHLKAGLLGGWFFLLIGILWLLKPVRSASLLTHLGAEELPYVRLGSVVVVAVVVAIYSRVVDRLSRLQVARGASLVFAGILAVAWIALRVGGEALGSERWFVWAAFIGVDVYSTVMVGLFWTYANDVVDREEADLLYGPVGLGGILGGVAGGLFVDVLVRTIGDVNLLALCAALGAGCAALPWLIERLVRPPPRPQHPRIRRGAQQAFEGLREVARTPYLLLIAGIVVTYEFAAATTDFVVSVVFERTFTDPVELARMFGRMGWIVSATALVSQLVLVPMVLGAKRLALLLPPLALGLSALGLTALPIAAMAIVLSAADRGLNYSLHQVTKESLYVPLSDVQKYKGKAFIDMVVDRGGKALSALSLMALIATWGVTTAAPLAVALVAVALWAVLAVLLGHRYRRTLGRDRTAHRPADTAPSPARPEVARPLRPGGDPEGIGPA